MRCRRRAAVLTARLLSSNAAAKLSMRTTQVMNGAHCYGNWPGPLRVAGPARVGPSPPRPAAEGLVRASLTASQGRYGRARIHRDLGEDHDEHGRRKCVIRLMQEEGLKARIRKRFVCTTDSDHELPVAANLLNREFTAEAPNQRWVGDTTAFTIDESSKLYLAAILDLFSRFVVGWAV